MNAFFEHIGSILKTKILHTTPLSGGDINTVYLLSSSKEKIVVKYNQNNRLPGLFEKEAKGLDLLRKSDSFRIPKIITYGVFQDHAYLLLEYIPSGDLSSKFWESFAIALSKLHHTQQETYGLDHSNYIGSLVQFNKTYKTSAEFYITQRLEPQFKMAQENGFSFQGLDRFYKNISEILPNEPASLIHGDLWNGNYLIGNDQKPVLIDPAVVFASREMDVAMMHLFGGFPGDVFSIYNEAFPLTPDWQSRIPLWQLYYILVHLNLFGSGYLQQTQQIMSQFS